MFNYFLWLPLFLFLPNATVGSSPFLRNAISDCCLSFHYSRTRNGERIGPITYGNHFSNCVNTGEPPCMSRLFHSGKRVITDFSEFITDFMGLSPTLCTLSPTLTALSPTRPDLHSLRRKIINKVYDHEIFPLLNPLY